LATLEGIPRSPLMTKQVKNRTENLGIDFLNPLRQAKRGFSHRAKFRVG